MSLNLAVIGMTGQLGRALIRQIPLQGHKAEFYARSQCDLTDGSAKLEAFIESLKGVDAVIIAAAYTAVDNAESDIETAKKVNSEAPAAIARACAKRGLALVHVSTDYVFDGSAAVPYQPDHPTGPISVYGATKLGGETDILESGASAAILRTAWVFDGTGKNFLTTMLRLAETRDTLGVVGDQIGRPIYAGHLADACIRAAEKLCADAKAHSGVFHVSGTGEPISWAEFARAIFDRAAADIDHEMTVNAIPTADYPTPATRPAYSVLDVSSFEKIFDISLPTWEDGLQAALNEWRANKKSM